MPPLSEAMEGARSRATRPRWAAAGCRLLLRGRLLRPQRSQARWRTATRGSRAACTCTQLRSGTRPHSLPSRPPAIMAPHPAPLLACSRRRRPRPRPRPRRSSRGAAGRVKEHLLSSLSAARREPRALRVRPGAPPPLGKKDALRQAFRAPFCHQPLQ
jgi:hypothetical protein